MSEMCIVCGLFPVSDKETGHSEECRKMEDKMCKTKREQIRRTCGEISRKSSFLYAFPEELTYEDLQMLKNINHKINVVHKVVFRRMHNGSEKE